MIFSFKVSVLGEDVYFNGFVDFFDYLIERLGNGFLLEILFKKCKEKLDKKKDVVKFFFFKIRRVSGRLVGKKVFVEIFKKKYIRRFRE